MTTTYKVESGEALEALMSTVLPGAWPLFVYGGRWTVWGTQVSMDEMFLFMSYVLYGEER